MPVKGFFSRLPCLGPLNRILAMRIWIIGLALVAALAGVAAAKKFGAGKPAYKDGDPEAMYLWHDAAGWHWRGTTGGKQHAFHGVIQGTGFSDLKVTRPGLEPRIRVVDGNTIRFDFDLFKGSDGFDWQATGACLTPELTLDGKQQPARVHVGPEGWTPVAFPFDACR